MSGSTTPPSKELVRLFLLGLLGEPQHSEIEAYLNDTNDLLNLTEVMDGHDELINDLRGLDHHHEPQLPNSVKELIARVEQLRPVDAATVSYAEQETTSIAATDGTPSDATEILALLAPPRQAGELGWLGNYCVLGKLGEGGMGIVFAGEDPVLKRRVALKVMGPRLANDARSRLRFLREAQAAAAIDHPNVVPIYQVGDSPMPFIAMPHLDGESLRDRLQRPPSLPLADVVKIGIETAQGLAAAHAAGLIHRDIKPANLWLAALAGGSDGDRFQVKILDFGLARPLESESDLTCPQAVLGTPAYMSPEQADGLPVDARCDLFSLGCVLYQLATGSKPFNGATFTAVLRAVADHTPPSPHSVRPELPPGLSDLIMQLLNKQPDHRPASANAVVRILRSVEMASASAQVASSALSPPKRRERKLAAFFNFGGNRFGCGLSLVMTIAAVLLVVNLQWSIITTKHVPDTELAMKSQTTDFKEKNDVVTAKPPPGRVSDVTAPRTYRGGVNIKVWRTTGDHVHTLLLTQPGALPVVPGDEFRVTAHIEPAAFLYVFWIDEEGKGTPVYPWTPGKWGTRPTKEAAVVSLDLPEQATKGFTITHGADGMETLIMLALDAPLNADDEDLKRRFGKSLPQRPIQGTSTAVWFENGKAVDRFPRPPKVGVAPGKDTPGTSADFALTDINDPVLRLHEQLRLQLQPLANYTASVSFARRSKQ
jgi:serine/threonine protein kinase